LIDESGIIDCNHKTEEMFRATHDRIIHKLPSDLSPKTQPDGIDSREKELRLVERTYSGEAQLFEWRHQRANGD
jgi:PAS domain-containing protein